ncbi:MAG: precorrin-8X methylmutase [Bacillota bacterium]
MNDTVFELRELHYSYGDGTTGLRGITASLRRGRSIAVLGANGAGKTTLFMHLVGVHRPTAGTVTFQDRPLSYDHRALKALRREVGMVFQDPDAQLFSAGVYQDVSFGPLNLGLPEKEVRRRVDRVLAAVGLTEFAGRPTHALSHGEKKRVALAGVLAMEPKVLVCDEPTAGLDPQGATQMAGLLRQLRDDGTTVIFSTHDVDLAWTLADWCLILTGGRLVGEGPPPAVFRDNRLVNSAGLARPWVLDVFTEVCCRGLAVEGMPPLTRDELVDALERSFRCRNGRGSALEAGGEAEEATPAGTAPRPAVRPGCTCAGRDVGEATSAGAPPRVKALYPSPTTDHRPPTTDDRPPITNTAGAPSRIYALYRRPMRGDEIEAESFRRIEAQVPEHTLRAEEWAVVRRLIHATADFGLVNSVRFSRGAVETGIKALQRGAPIYADANMIRAGLSMSWLRRICAGYSPGDIRCLVADGNAAEQARAAGLPRSLFAVRQARPFLDGGIALIGNSPVALLELNRMIREGEVRPALVVGMPVGFVHVEESKEELMELDVPWICVAGRRGGSSLAVAALHALAVLGAEKAQSG